MVDQNSQFFAILTNVGTAKQANADALGIAWKITQMAVGDANGTDPVPNPTQKTLINEWRRAPLNQLKVDDNDASIIVAEQVIPADIGGKWIREIGLYDADGDLVAVANCAPTYKPVLSQGSGRTQVLRMSLVVSNAANVQLKIDPSVVLATREWVTEELSRQDFKHSVLAATTAAINLTGLQTIDGVTLTAGARVLVKNQATAKENGIYTVVSGAAWKRSTDADSSAKVTPGLLVLVESGTVNGDSAWQLVTDAPIALGVTALSFEMAFGRTGVNAGTYRSVQVDKYGRVVAATNPTTVAGYGITDVYTKSETYSRTEIAKAIADSVTSAVNGLVDSAPGALDTLKELATAIGNDPNFAATMVNELAKKAPLLSPKFTGTPETPTPAASSTGLQIANMSALTTAVAAACRQFKTAVIGVSTNLTLTAAQMGNAVQFNGGAVTLALPSLTEVGNGASVMLRNPSATATQTIVVASSGSIVDAGTTGGSLALKPFEWAELASSGTAWFVVGRGKLREAAEIDSPSFTGTPTVPTAPVGATTAQIANMAAVMAAFQAFGLGTTVGVRIGDFDAVTQTGLYRADGSTEHTPFPNASMALLHIQFNDSGCFQLAAGCSGSIVNARLFWRSRAAGTWADWQQVARLDSPGFTGIPTAPTAGLGTNTAQIATMAALLQAVNAFKRSYSGNVVGIGADITLTGSQTGYAFNVTGPVTVTLPASADAGSGGTFVIRNVSSGGVTVAVGSGKIYEKNNAVSSLVIQPGEWIELQASTSNYFINQRGTLNEIGKVISDALASFSDSMIAAINNNSRSYRTQPAVGLATSVTLNTTTHLGALLQFNADALTVTLPSAADVPTGSVVTLRNPRASAQTLAVSAGTIVEEGASVAKVTLQGYEWIELSASGSQWFVSTCGKLKETVTVDQLQEACAPLAPLNSPGFTGKPTVPTPAASDNSQTAVNSAFVQRAVSGLAPVNSPAFTGTPTGPTQKVNDATKNLATTEFVELSKRNYSGPVLGFSSSMTLTASQSGRLYQANANNLTVTLPAAADAPGGTAYAFRNPTGSTLSITASSGSIVAGVTLATLVLQSGEYVELVSNSNTGWFVSSRGKLAETPTVDAMNAALTAAAPPGEVSHFALSSAPTGWLPRNGAAYSRTAYAALFAAIGTKFGAGDGSTTFNVPDDRELIDRAWTDGLNAADSGRVLFSTQAGQNEAHVHDGTANSGGAHAHATVFTRERIAAEFLTTGGNAVFGDQMSDGTQTLTTTTAPAHTHGLTINPAGGNETRMANRAYLACIKY